MEELPSTTADTPSYFLTLPHTASMSVEALQRRIAELEEELRKARKGDAPPEREKITQMSGEVVDTNPYRCVGVCVCVLMQMKKRPRAMKHLKKLKRPTCIACHLNKKMSGVCVCVSIWSVISVVCDVKLVIN